jgi:cytochrome c oxidase subunit II
MSQPLSPPLDDGSEKAEHRWATIATVIVVLFVVVATVAGVHQAVLPQARVETADPRTLHLRGEFIESNLGSAVEADGSVTLRFVVVPTGTPVTIRATSADVVHGFLIPDTTVNLMLVPGYVSSLATTFATQGERHMPCHEFCGTGHEGMWARIRTVDPATFAKLAADRRRVTCVE